MRESRALLQPRKPPKVMLAVFVATRPSIAAIRLIIGNKSQASLSDCGNSRQGLKKKQG
jgi:hypothetical protein